MELRDILIYFGNIALKMSWSKAGPSVRTFVSRIGTRY